jgi:hypothetical protein
MSEVFGDLDKLLGSPLWLIFTIAAATGGIAHHFAAAELKSAIGRKRLRSALQGGGHWRRLYIQLLTRALDRLDQSLGDVGKAAFSLSSPFGNREVNPYWTGWSFDRCALLAAIYPLLSLFIVWVWTGEAGPIAELLGMKSAAAWWSRLISAAVLMAFVCFVWRCIHKKDTFVSLLLILSIAIIVAGTAAFFEDFSGTLAGLLFFTFVASVTVSYVVAGAVGFTVIFGSLNPATAALAPILVFMAQRWEKRNRIGHFWWLFWPTMLAANYLALGTIVSVGSHQNRLSAIIMLGIIPITNVPFDWATIGLTRALLRRGCEGDTPSPVFLGLLDFMFGLILLLLLAVALIAALQIADRVIVHYGGQPVANIVMLLDNIAEKPGDPANYWAYFTLFSTLIPSALNAVIGAVSLIGWWLPRAREWALTQLLALDRDENDEGIRVRVSAVLALQVGVGTALTCLVLWGLWELLLEMPFVFPFVLDLLKQFALALA